LVYKQQIGAALTIVILKPVLVTWELTLKNFIKHDRLCHRILAQGYELGRSMLPINTATRITIKGVGKNEN
jgi:hypothetical protein